jgi:spore maturation protein CgeB
VPLIGLDRDAPWHLGIRWRRLAWFRLLRPLDIYASHTLQPTWKFAPVKIYCANAAWVRNFNLHGHSLQEMRDPNFYKYDVSFLGNLDGQRFKEHAKREKFFQALAERLARLGIRYSFAQGSGATLPEQIDLIQRSRINLNYGAAADHGAVRSWGLPERCYGVPGCGGFLLSDERRHVSDDFDVASEWAGFRDLDDCVERILYWLAHFEDSRRVAEAAHARVLKHHTYELRAQSLLSAGQTFIGADPT